MKRGGTFLSAAAILALAACGGGKLEVRAIPTPIAPGKKPVSFRLAEAHGQLALGNVALALESYRKAMREDPQSADAVAGLAVCYDRMGRYDLSRRYYEMALALEPGDPHLLAALAASLEQQGKVVEAARVRAEIAARVAPAPAQPPAEEPLRIDTAPLALADASRTSLPAVAFQPEPEPVAAPAPGPAAISPAAAAARAAIPPAAELPRPVVGRSVTVTLPPPRPAPARAQAAAAPANEPMPATAKAEIPKARPKPAEPVAMPEPAAAPAPQARPEPVPVAAAVAVAQVAASRPVAASPAAATPAPVAIAAPARKTGARLERLSLNEVALVTSGQPQWRPKLVAQGARSATVRFVPLQRPETRMAAVRLLNAARFQGLAARSRSYLVRLGWRSLAIGDADSVRARSLVLYPASRRTLGLRVAAQFGFEARQHAGASQVTVLLGRDAANFAPLRARS